MTLINAQELHMAREWGLCVENVASFYTNLEEMYEGNGYQANHVLNRDKLVHKLVGVVQGLSLSKEVLDLCTS